MLPVWIRIKAIWIRICIRILDFATWDKNPDLYLNPKTLKPKKYFSSSHKLKSLLTPNMNKHLKN